MVHFTIVQKPLHGISKKSVATPIYGGYRTADPYIWGVKVRIL